MGKRGRPTFGTQHVDKLNGSPTARERLRVVLETIAGTLSIDEACRQLGIGPSRFHDLRQELLQAAMDRADGRPGAQAAEAAAEHAVQVRGEVAALRAANDDLRIELEAARIREEIAVVLPHLSRAEKKGRTTKGRRGSGSAG